MHLTSKGSDKKSEKLYRTRVISKWYTVNLNDYILCVWETHAEPLLYNSNHKQDTWAAWGMDPLAYKTILAMLY